MKQQKTFVFLTGPIRNMGGSQLYTLRKMEWLRSEGWKVIVLSARKGKILIPQFLEFERLIYECLEIPAYFYPNWKRRQICQGIVKSADICGEVHFQSHTQALATWAELLAEMTGGKHVCHLLDEHFLANKEPLLELMRFKLAHDELFGISEQSIPSLLGDSALTHGRRLGAVGCSVGNVEDYACPSIPNVGGDFRILILGRYGKKYVETSLVAVCNFAKSNLDRKIVLYVVGTPCKKASELGFVKIVAGVSNLVVLWIGDTFPLPRSLFVNSDVCLASAGCATVAYREKCPCISIDSKDQKAIGILGISTRNSLFRADEPQVEPEVLLREILLECKYRREDIKLPQSPRLDYSSHAEVLAQPNRHKYFSYARCRMSFRERLTRIGVCLGGARFYFAFKFLIGLVRKTLNSRRGGCL